MRKYIVLADIILLVMAALILLIDVQIKNQIVDAAKSLEAKLDEQRGTEGSGNLHPSVSRDIPSSIVLSGEAVETTGDSANGAKRARPRNRADKSAANGSAGNTSSGVSGSSDQVGS